MSIKKKKTPKKSPTYTAVLTAAALIFAIVLIALSVLDSGDDGDGGTDTWTNTETPSVTDSLTDAVVSDTETGTETETDVITETEESTAAETEPPAPEQTVPVGIYVETSRKKYVSVTEYASEWPENDSDPLWTLDTWTYKDRDNLICDVDYFAVFASDEEEIKVSYWDETWTERWDANVTETAAKIGFEFTVVLKNGESVTKTVLGPADTFCLEEYFELYLYDCVAHAHDSWYSHITEKTDYDDTQNVMIKITLRDGCYDVDEILMTAFVYTPDELDESGRYTGANKATCTVKREG